VDERTGIKVCVIGYDIYRKILVGGEFPEINTENNIYILERLADEYWLALSSKEANL
jgi:hypothetical protein